MLLLVLLKEAKFQENSGDIPTVPQSRKHLTRRGIPASFYSIHVVEPRGDDLLIKGEMYPVFVDLFWTSSPQLTCIKLASVPQEAGGHRLAAFLRKLFLSTYYYGELPSDKIKITFQGADRTLGKEKEGEGHVWPLTLESSDLFG